MPLKYCTPFSIFERVTRFSKSGEWGVGSGEWGVGRGERGEESEEWGENLKGTESKDFLPLYLFSFSQE